MTSEQTLIQFDAAKWPAMRIRNLCNAIEYMREEKHFGIADKIREVLLTHRIRVVIAKDGTVDYEILQPWESA